MNKKKLSRAEFRSHMETEELKSNNVAVDDCPMSDILFDFSCTCHSDQKKDIIQWLFSVDIYNCPRQEEQTLIREPYGIDASGFGVRLSL